jgi:hypothetical protein
MTYAFGLTVETYRGLKRVEHGGAYGGYRTTITRFPDQSFSVIILANLGTIAPDGLATKVADLFLAEAYTEGGSTQDGKEITLSEEQLTEKSGTYWSADSEMVIDLIPKQGRMWLKVMGIELPLAAMDVDTLKVTGAPVDGSIHFEQPATGTASRISVVIAGSKPDPMEKIAIVTPSDPDLQAMVGEYYSDELRAWIQLVLQDGKVVIKDRRHTLPFRFGKKDMFIGDTLNFYSVYAENGAVNELLLCSGRAHNISYKRIGNV